MHRNAKLTPARRLLLVQLIAAGRPVTHVAAAQTGSAAIAAAFMGAWSTISVGPGMLIVGVFLGLSLNHRSDRQTLTHRRGTGFRCRACPVSDFDPWRWGMAPCWGRRAGRG